MARPVERAQNKPLRWLGYKYAPQTVLSFGEQMVSTPALQPLETLARWVAAIERVTDGSPVQLSTDQQGNLIVRATYSGGREVYTSLLRANSRQRADEGWLMDDFLQGLEQAIGESRPGSVGALD